MPEAEPVEGSCKWRKGLQPVVLVVIGKQRPTQVPTVAAPSQRGDTDRVTILKSMRAGDRFHLDLDAPRGAQTGVRDTLRV